MNFKIPIAGLLIGLLVACSETEHDPKVPSTPKQQQVRQSKPEVKQPPETGAKKPTNPFDRASFPKESCGDKLPNGSKTDTAKLYPVFIDYNESNLQTVKANYCRDAFKTLRKDKGQEAIQVASFTGEERANQFKEFLGNKLDRASAEVGEPRIIAVNPTDDIKPKGAKIASKESVIKAAKLTSEQAAQLSSIVGEGKDFKTQDVVVLPTDVPDGFKVAHFAAWKQTVANSPEFSGGHYEVLYENSRGACFTINGGVIQPIGDQPTHYERVLSLLSPALGSVDVGITGFDRAATRSFLGFTQSMNRITRGRNEYLFESPPGSIQKAGGGFQVISGCSRIDKKDAIRIVQSFQFLNP
jgi:hypothetical protein